MIQQLRQFFEDVCHWEQGLDLQILALQAVMADQLGGETVHHALGIDPSERQAGAIKASQKPTEAAKVVSQWRWLIIDEISMISASFLAEIDMRLRDLISTAQPYKMRSDNLSRPFGGLNVLLIGDFWQLDPPQGVSLASLPVDYIRRARKFDPSAPTAHGQALL